MPRRAFLGAASLSTATLLSPLPLVVGCGSEDESAAGGLGSQSQEPRSGPGRAWERACLQAESPLDGGAMRRLVFDGAAGRVFGATRGRGLDGRRYTDLSVLTPQARVTPNEAFYVRTRRPDTLPADGPWSVTLGGLVERRVRLDLREILAESEEQGLHLLECSGNFREGGFGLLSVGSFRGVPLARLVQRVQALPSAARLEVIGNDEHSQPASGGRSTRGASWVLSPEQLADTGAFLATHLNGAPLPADNGYPLRLVNPGWYGCSCIKWVVGIDWVAEDAPSTSQMREFAGRTHQRGVPELARDYAAPEIQAAAMPVRVEPLGRPEELRYRVVGITWGGDSPPQNLEITFDGGQTFRAVECGTRDAGAPWQLWSTQFEPEAPGTYEIACRVPGSGVEQRRLDSRYYARRVTIPAL